MSEQRPRSEQAIKEMCNYGWLEILGKDTRGNYVTQPTEQGQHIHAILVRQGCFEQIRKLLEGAS